MSSLDEKLGILETEIRELEAQILLRTDFWGLKVHMSAEDARAVAEYQDQKRIKIAEWWRLYDKTAS